MLNWKVKIKPGLVNGQTKGTLSEMSFAHGGAAQQAVRENAAGAPDGTVFEVFEVVEVLRERWVVRGDELLGEEIEKEN